MIFNDFLKQADQVQKKMKELQDQMASNEYTGNSGGTLVTIVINGRNEVRKVQIDPSLLNLSEKEILEDLLVAAFNDAKGKADEDSKASLSNVFGNVPLPPGFKMPF